MQSKKIIDISPQNLKEYIKNTSEKEFILIDVREPAEYEASHIPGALLIPLRQIETKILDLNPNKRLIFYCRSGKRSKVAANFVSDTGLSLNPVYNLSGGILAWEGRTLKDFPRIKLFEASSDPTALLKKALELEKGAERFYMLCAENAELHEVHTFASKLASLERSHAKAIYKLLKELQPDIEIFDKLYESYSFDIIEGGLEIERAIELLLKQEGPACLNFAEMALDIEYSAYDIYKNLSQRTSTSQFIRISLELAEQEKIHARIVASMLSNCLE